jgi:hypothetical protein
MNAQSSQSGKGQVAPATRSGYTIALNTRSSISVQEIAWRQWPYPLQILQ